MIGYLEYLDVPVKIGLAIIGSFLVMQIIGEFLEFKGKVVPEFLKVRKFFSRRKREKNETTQTLREVKQLPASHTLIKAITSTGTKILSPSKLTYVINGTGSGHHVGMSQSGAYGMAKEGFTYDQILKFYYTGTDVV